VYRLTEYPSHELAEVSVKFGSAVACDHCHSTIWGIGKLPSVCQRTPIGLMIGLYCVVLDWIGLDWIGLYWIGLDCIGLDWIVLYCIVLDCIVLYCIVL